MTEILKPTKENIEKSAKLILNDEIVAIPTETVYGLGANGLSDIAVSKIFKAKNRPQDNPLILHISDYEMMDELVCELNDDIKEFLNYFWPGPLTVVMKKKDIIPETVSCGLDTVAIRMPKHEIAIDFIKECGVPIAAPSANISGKPSPTTAEDVFTDMNGKISVILDGGLCNIGIESTVLDLTKKPYTILRPGLYTREDFLKYEDEILIDDAIVSENTIPKSPGQKYKHYAPKAKVIVISTIDRIKSSKEIEKILRENKDLKIGIFKFDETFLNVESENILSLGSIFDLKEMSKILFKGLREFDEKNVDLIVVDSVAALVPQAEIDGDMGDAHMGLQARLMSQALRKLTGIINKSKATVIFINQIRMKIGVMFGNPETTTGGNALKFYASVRADIRRTAQIKSGDDIIGNRTKVKIVKNKIAAPFRVAEFDIMYNEGISKTGDIIDLAVEHEILGKSGAFYKYNDQNIGQGRENAKRYLLENPDVMAEIDAKVRAKIRGEEFVEETPNEEKTEE